MPGAEDVVETLLSFPGGRMASVSASRIGQQKVRSLRITELDRVIEVDLLRPSVTIYRHIDSDAATERRARLPPADDDRDPGAGQMRASRSPRSWTGSWTSSRAGSTPRRSGT